MARAKLDACFREVGCNARGHLRVEWGQHLRKLFDERDRKAAASEVFSHFEPDETSADHDRRLSRSLLEKGADASRIGDCPDHEHAIEIAPFDRRDERCGTGREHQLVPVFVAFLSRFQVADSNRRVGAIDCEYFMLGLDVDVEALPKE